MNMPAVSTLVWMKWPTNTGYALTSLEQLFYETALRLAAGDRDRVYFAYTDLSGGAPTSLPAAFPHVGALDLTRADLDLDVVTRYVRDRAIDLVLVFDLQPAHRTFAAMRQGGVTAIVCYWGAPISSTMPAWRRWLKRAALWLDRSRADGMIFESQAMADLALHGRGATASMVDVVPLGVDTDAIRPAPSRYVHEALGIPPGQKVIVFSGHCTPRKGIKTLIEAAIELLTARRRTDCHFVLCGNRAGEDEPYRQMYAGLGIDERIRFAGFRTDIIAIFQSAYCGVIPSSGWDSFTLSSVEMAATGLPVVASRLQGLAEAVVDGETGLLFEPGNAKALADCLDALLDDEARARRYGDAGRARSERELTRAQQATRLEAALRRRLPMAEATTASTPTVTQRL